MAKFGSFVKMSDEYWTGLRDNPSSDREATVKNAVESVGGKLLFFGFVHGEYDVLVIAETPTHSDYIAVLAKAAFGGMISAMNTFSVVDQDVFADGFAKMDKVQYTPPGS